MRIKGKGEAAHVMVLIDRADAPPPLYDENGELIKDRYVVTIRIPDRREMHSAFASEWGMMGYISEAIRLTGDDGRRQVKITLTVEPGEKTGTLGKMPSAPNP